MSKTPKKEKIEKRAEAGEPPISILNDVEDWEKELENLCKEWEVLDNNKMRMVVNKARFSLLKDLFSRQIKKAVLEVLERVRLEEKGQIGTNPRNDDWDTGYNQAIANLNQKIKEIKGRL